MKLSAKQIKEVAFSIQEKGYSPKEVDELLDKVLEDYEEFEGEVLLDGTNTFPYEGKITINLAYNGEIGPNTVEYDGTVADWIHIDNKGIFADVPCINCKDGKYIQKL